MIGRGQPPEKVRDRIIGVRESLGRVLLIVKQAIEPERLAKVPGKPTFVDFLRSHEKDIRNETRRRVAHTLAEASDDGGKCVKATELRDKLGIANTEVAAHTNLLRVELRKLGIKLETHVVREKDDRGKDGKYVKKAMFRMSWDKSAAEEDVVNDVETDVPTLAAPIPTPAPAKSIAPPAPKAAPTRPASPPAAATKPTPPTQTAQSTQPTPRPTATPTPHKSGNGSGIQRMGASNRVPPPAKPTPPPPLRPTPRPTIRYSAFQQLPPGMVRLSEMRGCRIEGSTEQEISAARAFANFFGGKVDAVRLTEGTDYGSQLGFKAERLPPVNGSKRAQVVISSNVDGFARLYGGHANSFSLNRDIQVALGSDDNIEIVLRDMEPVATGKPKYKAPPHA